MLQFEKPLIWIGSSKRDLMAFPEDHQGDTYRAVYTVKFEGYVYVLHCFQKKSKKGIATPKPDMDKIRARLTHL